MLIYGRYTLVSFRKFSEFPRGTMYDILQDAYSFDSRNKEIWDKNWHESDDFFYDNPDIADKYGLVTCIDAYPIGFVTWSVGFKLYDRKDNRTESAYMGDYLYYEIIL